MERVEACIFSIDRTREMGFNLEPIEEEEWSGTALENTAKWVREHIPERADFGGGQIRAE